MSDLQNLTKENKYKRIRNKNSYMEAFLERRKQAADFALKGKNKSGYKYTKPNYYIHEGKEIYNSKKKYTYELNSNENSEKNKFYKTYSTYNNNLKKNYKEGNRSNNNMIAMETENNQYYLSDGLQKSYKNYNFWKMNGHYNPYYKYKNNQINNRFKNIGNYFEKSNEEYQELIDELLTNEEINQKYKNIKHHSINFSSKNKNSNRLRYINIKDSPQNEIFLKTDKNEFLNNYNNKKTKRINYNKKNIESSPNIKANFINNIQYLSTPNDIGKNSNKKYKSKSNSKVNCNINLISSKKEKENKRNINSDNNIYYEGIDNHRFYDSNKINDYKYSCETYKLKNRTQNKNQGLYSKSYSEPQNLKGNKKLYKVKTTYGINKKNNIEKNQINDISPIRTYCRCNYEDYNDFKNIEKIYESQSIYGNSGNNSSNIKLINNIKTENDFSSDKKYFNTENNSKDIRARGLDLLKIYSAKIIKDTGNTKAISTVYNSQQIPNNNLDENNIKIIENSNDKSENNYKEINYSANNNKSGKALLKEDKTKLKGSQYSENINKNPEKLKSNNIEENYNNISSKKNNKDKNNEIYFTKIENNHIKNQLDNDIFKDNIEIKIQNYNNNDYEEIQNIVEHDNSKDRYDSFLRQKDEKEPNIQSHIINSMMTSKDESYLKNNNNNLIKNIQDKIKILKNNMNKDKNEDLNKNYIKEIDNYFNKIKQKEEKNNSILNEFYQELTINNNTKKNNQKTDNIIDNNKLKKGKTKRNKKVVIQRSHRLQNMIKQILDNQKYKNFGKKNQYINPKIRYDKFSPSKKYNHKNVKKNLDLNELDIKNHFSDIKLSKFNHTSAPNINLIVEEGNYDNAKIINENEYFKLKKRSIKIERPNLTLKSLKPDNINSYRNKFDLYGYYNFGNQRFTSKFGNKINVNVYSPRIILSDINNKIMPPNEI